MEAISILVQTEVDIAFPTIHMGKVRRALAVLAPLTFAPCWEWSTPSFLTSSGTLRACLLRGGVRDGNDSGELKGEFDDIGLPCLGFGFPALVKQAPTEA